MKYQVLKKYGVDVEIARLQDTIFAGIDISTYDCYGRIYRNLKGATNIPEWYLGKKEYSEVLMNDKVAITSFFYVADEYNVNELICDTTASLIVQCDLAKCYPTITAERADELIINEFFNLLKDEKPTRIVKGLNALNDFDTSKLKNMQPFFFFRIDFPIRYNYSSCLNI